MLQDKLGRPFKVGQAIIFLQQGLVDAVIKELKEDSVLANPNSAPVHSIVVEISFKFPVPPGATVQVSNLVIAQEPGSNPTLK